MAIANTEAVRIYEGLADKARQAGLGWVLSQVEEQYALGVVASKTLSVNEIRLFEEEEFPPTSRKRRSTKATFLVSRPYTPQERLGILLDGLLSGVVHLNQIANAVLLFATSELKSSPIEFAPDAEVESPFRLEPSINWLSRSEHLAGLLDELKREIKNDG